MAYWLIKSEPSSYSWQDQLKKNIEPWSGVRNYQARNNLRAMRLNDLAFFYHSVKDKEIVGIVKIVRESYPDPTDAEQKWSCVDVKTVCPLNKTVTLEEINLIQPLQNIALLKQPRLSVMPITNKEWQIICRLGKLNPEQLKNAY
ncbi:hypothetical protein COMNV_01159 [Commensalibacter sp. Nvir]|uniref:EVE domain-containing protein n=1 Tax=Commensalibacter sp. Nvir TaxID=3069817 RepID=UPI002D23411C|nr:hypothetical protein COMNV_01159 [Commensalibacter sp. Nvir]